MKKQFSFEYEVFESITDLNEKDAQLLEKARDLTDDAYAPYSQFRVAAVARMADGSLIAGTNQENASYPVGICAERVLLSTISSIKPRMAIESIAISYNSNQVRSEQPVSPCGICRQSLQEYEQRIKQPIRLIMAGMKGQIIILKDSAALLPLAFTSEAMR
jgi:cytidine deaminase